MISFFSRFSCGGEFWVVQNVKGPRATVEDLFHSAVSSKRRRHSRR